MEEVCGKDVEVVVEAIPEYELRGTMTLSGIQNDEFATAADVSTQVEIGCLHIHRNEDVQLVLLNVGPQTIDEGPDLGSKTRGPTC